MDELLTIDELCNILKVKKSYIYKLTSTNRIPYYRIGGLKFRLHEVEKWIIKKKENVYSNKKIENIFN